MNIKATLALLLGLAFVSGYSPILRTEGAQPEKEDTPKSPAGGRSAG